MTQDKDEVVVRDLGSTNGIRINGERVERGRLRTGDELSIAHIRYRLENGAAQDLTLADPNGSLLNGMHPPVAVRPSPSPEAGMMDKPLGEVVRNALGNVPDKCRIQVIVQMKHDSDSDEDPQERS
jgi:hypothetical protein